MIGRRWLAALLLLAGVMALVAWWRPAVDPVERSAPSATRNAEPSSAAALSKGESLRARAQSMAGPNPAAKPEPPPLPFSFVGNVTEGGRTVIVLRRGGRTLKVRGPGPLDDQYAVDAIQDGLMLVRYLPMGVQQVLELSARQEPIPGGSAAQTEQD